jgi:PAS domain-containing protein
MSVLTNRAFAGQEVDTLRAALDEVELGVILLDNDLNVQFLNRAFLEIYRLAEKSVVLGLGFAALVRLVVGRTRKMSTARFNAYVKSRAHEIRIGIEGAHDVRMDDDRVIRVNRKVLPDGGRMPMYADVTDLVQQAEKLRELATVDGMTGLFNRRHFLALAEIEWSRYQRHRRPLSVLMIDIDNSNLSTTDLATTPEITSSCRSQMSVDKKSASPTY